jgi:TBC1 domain family protein 5
VEAIFQGAAKKVLERGEHLGINQAVRDAVGEIKRNVQGFQEARLSPRAAKDSLASDPRSSSSPSSSRALAAIERRNRQLAGMLDETVVSLRTLATSGDLENRVKTLELIEIAAARVQFVRVYLEDPSMVIPDEPISAGSISEESEVRQEEQGTTTAPGQDLSMTSPKSAAEVDATEGISNLSITGSPAAKPRGSTSHPGLISPDAMDTSNDVSASALESKAPKPLPTTPSPAPAPVLAEAPEPPAPAPAPPPKRPRAPIPTRSTLAQSSFSWMLEPDVSASSSPPKPPAFPSASSHASSSSHRKRPSGNAASRERNAFLFGEVTAEADDGGRRPISTDEIFGLEPIRKPTGSSK